MTYDSRHQTGKRKSMDGASGGHAKIGVATAVLGLLTAILTAVTALLALQNSKISSKNDMLTTSVGSLHATASALQSQNGGLQASNSAARDKISSLQSQLAAPTASPDPTATPSGRHAGIITIAAAGGGPGIDLDSPSTNPQWNSGTADIGFNPDGAIEYYGNVTGLVLGATQATYDSCRGTTGYATPDISIAAASAADENFCIKTDEHRYAAMKILQITPKLITLDVAVYDPPDSN